MKKFLLSLLLLDLIILSSCTIISNNGNFVIKNNSSYDLTIENTVVKTGEISEFSNISSYDFTKKTVVFKGVNCEVNIINTKEYESLYNNSVVTFIQCDDNYKNKIYNCVIENFTNNTILLQYKLYDSYEFDDYIKPQEKPDTPEQLEINFNFQLPDIKFYISGNKEIEPIKTVIDNVTYFTIK